MRENRNRGDKQQDPRERTLSKIYTKVIEGNREEEVERKEGRERHIEEKREGERESKR